MMETRDLISDLRIEIGGLEGRIQIWSELFRNMINEGGTLNQLKNRKCTQVLQVEVGINGAGRGSRFENGVFLW